MEGKYEDLVIKPIPSVKTRYEFDVGPDGLQLIKDA
jgi:hypothetical protein